MQTGRETRVVYSPPAMNALGWVRNRPLGQVIAGAAVLAALGAAIVYLGTARRVTLVAGGVERTIYTHAATVGGALRSAGETITSDDFLQPAADTPLRQVDRIEFRQARPILVRSSEGDEWVTTAASTPADILAAAGLRSFPSDRVWADGIPVSDPTLPLEHVPGRLRLDRGRALALSQPFGTTEIWSSASTLGEALIDAGIRLRQGDSIAPQAQARLRDLDSAAYLASRPIEVSVDGITLQAMAAGPTVGQALAQAGVTLAGLDRSSPAASEPSPGERGCDASSACARTCWSNRSRSRRRRRLNSAPSSSSIRARSSIPVRMGCRRSASGSGMKTASRSAARRRANGWPSSPARGSSPTAPRSS